MRHLNQQGPSRRTMLRARVLRTAATTNQVKKQRKDLNMPTDTKQMDAVIIQASGPPALSLAYRSEPVPEPGPGEVLVEVHAAAVTRLDVANAAGLLGTPLPMIPGVDFAGIVVSDGDHTGQEVWGSGRRSESSGRARMRASSPCPRRGCHASPSGSR